ncbi:Chitinase 2 [Spiromyces aspiralis]|uniref:Chitinase 2 n=1 Tax=Spiromyces aspiralis TaxID=68401 RepID=A0ACC1HW84_9FUNG|nr:Chitinase 2 [Spiromyces aspiralis]
MAAGLSSLAIYLVFSIGILLHSYPNIAAQARIFDPNRKDNLALYWGQNSFGVTHAGMLGQEALEDYCQNDSADILLLSFLNVFNAASAGGVPGLDFAETCKTTFPNTTLLHCPQIAKGIKYCQKQGKIVLLSLGGAAGSYGFASEDEARQFADKLWDMFMGGSADLRPFDDAVVDGVDLDIEGGQSTGYVTLVGRLREKFKQVPDRRFYVTAAPQCPFPDGYLGSVIDSAHLDMVFVQFYNNWCSALSYPSQFNFDDWDNWARDRSLNPDVKVYFGLPGSTTAARSGYIDPTELARIIPDVRSKYPSFGGVSMWDASQGASNKIGDKSYTQHVADILRANGDTAEPAQPEDTSKVPKGDGETAESTQIGIDEPTTPNPTNPSFTTPSSTAPTPSIKDDGAAPETTAVKSTGGRGHGHDHSQHKHHCCHRGRDE